MDNIIEQIRTILDTGWIGPALVILVGYVFARFLLGLFFRGSGGPFPSKSTGLTAIVIDLVRSVGNSVIGQDDAPRTTLGDKPESPGRPPRPPASQGVGSSAPPAKQADDAPFAPTSEVEPFSFPDSTEVEITGLGGPIGAAPATADSSLTVDAPDYDVRRVYFGTDREAETTNGNVTSFGHKRADELTLGIAHITVPRKRPWGTIPRPKKLPFVGITIQKEKAAKHFTISECRIVDAVEFSGMAGAEAHVAKRFENAAFIFVHGFNVQFNAALFRCAQMAEDIGFDGPAFLYSWPAIGGGIKGTINYVTDIESADQAATHLDEFVDLVLETPGVERVHMITHSMGNKLLAEWFDKAGTKVQARNTKTIDQLILAAPDIDVKTFKDVSDYMKRFANGVTLYACATDLALIASKKLRNDYPRAGDVPSATGPVVVPGIDTIDISAVGNRITSLKKYLGDDSFLDHSLFAEDREVLTDLGNLMRSGIRPPDARSVAYNLETKGDAQFWVLPV